MTNNRILFDVDLEQPIPAADEPVPPLGIAPHEVTRIDDFHFAASVASLDLSNARDRLELSLEQDFAVRAMHAANLELKLCQPLIRCVASHLELPRM